jgi:peptidoglycan/LPS O-acetylase OafA/YrhL
MPTQKSIRLRELDFLRGIAIILVLFNHIPFFEVTSEIGWIGVDLFFVLSGFLISGLLFKEYIKFGNINPRLFLIRRAFKIYPVYYIFMLPYLAIKVFYFKRFYLLGFIYDSIFVQNYSSGWGYACPASWSLAVEEHFYFGFSIFLWLIINQGKLIYRKNTYPLIIIAILLIVFIIRVYSNIYLTIDSTKLYTMTHLRIDSLLFGTLIAFLFYFRLENLNRFYLKYKYILVIIMILSIAWTPFLSPKDSVFVRTSGFSLLYIGFGILLLIFLLEKNINQILDKLVNKKLISIISKVGLSSFSIYYIHSLIIFINEILFKEFEIHINRYISSTILFCISILTGIFMTIYVENFFLKIRDKYFPSRG